MSLRVWSRRLSDSALLLVLLACGNDRSIEKSSFCRCLCDTEKSVGTGYGSYTTKRFGKYRKIAAPFLLYYLKLASTHKAGRALFLRARRARGFMVNIRHALSTLTCYLYKGIVNAPWRARIGVS